jgi:thymidylate synthase
MMQEIMARQLGLEVGPYTHFVGSMHIYENHLDMAELILNEPEYQVHEMPRMPGRPWEGIQQLLLAEESIRLTGRTEAWPESPYWRELSLCLQFHAAWRSEQTYTQNLVVNEISECYAQILPLVAKR